MYIINKAGVSMSSKNTTEYRHRVKKSLVYAFDNKCYLCKHTFPIKVYEFHHLKPSEKRFQLGRNTHSIPNVMCEAQKCIMLCPNCHRMVTLGYTLLPNKTCSNFNKDKFTDIYNSLKSNKSKLSMILTKDTLVNYLKMGYSLTDIGNLYNVRRQTVSKYCSLYNINLNNYKTTLSNILNRDTLKELIRTLPFTQIAIRYGVTDNAIRKLCKKYKLPYTKKSINSISDKDWVSV